MQYIILFYQFKSSKFSFFGESLYTSVTIGLEKARIAQMHSKGKPSNNFPPPQLNLVSKVGKHGSIYKLIFFIVQKMVKGALY